MIDGVIKYEITLEADETCIDETLFAPMERVREELIALRLIGESPEGIGYGNLSVRAEGASFYITATQTGNLASLEPKHYPLVERYDFSAFTLHARGSCKPSSEALSHAAIYHLSDEINSVIHIHNDALWRFMLDAGMLKTTAEYGTAKMTEEIFELYGSKAPLENNLFVMEGHDGGIIAFGRTPDEALMVLLRLVGTYLER